MKLLLTQELGRLATWLRILGYDTEYTTCARRGSVIIQALREDRIIVTRNRRLPRPAGFKTVVLISEQIHEQIREVLKQLNVTPNCDMMFSRCTVCNEELTSVEKEKIQDRVPEYVLRTQNDFRLCPRCRRVYWQGTHWGNVRQTFTRLGL
ncbi:MAG TPA: Mut7-C RNAse domain-containing protein [Patescibacteria group bacterium]|nr:Mut7-C RNAse domain-containing protein [Patescibacteria group bacterium]